jgi:hypothetical protein
MAKCSFSIPFATSPEEILAKAKSGITTAGGQFSGDVAGGEFSIATFVGTIAGRYDMGPGQLNIDIDDKPMFLSCSKIEEELKKYLAV